MGEQYHNALISFDYQIILDFERKSIIPGMIGVYRLGQLPEDSIKIGFFGGSGIKDCSGKEGPGVSDKSLDFAIAVGEYVAEHNQKSETKLLPVTGACPGNPHAFAKAADQGGVQCLGLSPFFDENAHIKSGYPNNVYAAIMYLGQNLAADFQSTEGRQKMSIQLFYRDVFNILGVHGGIYAGGSYGTLHELTANVLAGKDVALAYGTGGAVDLFVDKIMPKIGKNMGGEKIISDGPKDLVDGIVHLDQKRRTQNGKRQDVFLDQLVIRINKEIKR